MNAHEIWAQQRLADGWTYGPTRDDAAKRHPCLLAYDAVTAGLEHCPNHVRLRQLQGLALARSGASERALSVLQSLADEGNGDEESLGMLARTYKDLWTSAARSANASHYLARSAE